MIFNKLESAKSCLTLMTIILSWKPYLDLFLCMCLGLILSPIIYKLAWIPYMAQTHIFFEGVCLFLAFFAFLIFCNTHEFRHDLSPILIFGLFISAAFNIFHCYFHLSLSFYPKNYFDLSSRFYILSRIALSMSILFSIAPSKEYKIKKQKCFFISCIIIAVISFIIIYFRAIIPPFYTNGLVITNCKIIVYSLLALLNLTILIELIYKSSLSCQLSKEKLVKALILLLASELCLIVKSDSYFSKALVVYSHVLSVYAFYYIYRSVFISYINFPYKEIQSLCKKSEERFKSAFDYINTGIIICDTNLEIIGINTFLKKTLGYDKNELNGLNISDITCSTDSADNNSDKSISDFNCIELNLIGKGSNSLHPVRMVSSVVYDGEGKPSYIVIETTDISSEKKIIDLQNIIESDQKKLEDTIKLEQSRNEFYANLTHELRTPINVILGAYQLIDFYLNNSSFENIESIRKNLKYIKQNSFRLMRIIGNLIDTTKADAGFLKLTPVNTDIVCLVEDISMSIAQYASLKGIELIFDTEFEEMLISIDPDKIERIVLNLLSNAIKFTNNGGKILVYMYEDDSKIYISVKDTGIGIPKSKQSMVFEKFRQVENGYVSSIQGSGLGLSLSKTLAILHNGDIFLKSAEGQGSEFILSLPKMLTEDSICNISASSENNRVERINIEFSDIYMN